MRYLLRFIFVCALMCFLIGSLVMPARTAAQPVSAALSSVEAVNTVLALVNAWRIQEGLWPLKENRLLDAMAASQAAYVLPKISSIVDDADWHKDSSGRMPRERAGVPPYEWPLFQKSNHSDRAIGENAAVGSPQYAVNFWKSSPIHRRAALNGQYREVGIAAVPLDAGSFEFIMDFGARPDVLTVLADPTASTLYVPNELSRFIVADPGAMKIRVFSADGTSLTDLMPWQLTVTLPKGTQGKLVVLYTNGNYQALSLLDLSQDIAVLPVDDTNSTAAPTVTPTVEAAPTDSATPQTAVTAEATTIAPPASTLLPTTAPTAAASLILFYDSQSLVVYNNTKRPLDLTGLSIGSSGGRVSIAAWRSISDFPVSAFPGGHCLQVTVTGGSIPDSLKCLYVRSALQVSAEKAFWTLGDFMVKRGDVTLATCSADATRCEVKLSATN